MQSETLADDYHWRTLQRLVPGKGVTGLLVLVLSIATEQWDVFAVFVAETIFMSWTILFVGIERNRAYATVAMFFQLIFFGFGLWYFIGGIPQLYECDIQACRGHKKDFYYTWWGILWLSVFFNALITGVLVDIVGISILVPFFRPKQKLHYKLG